MRALPAVLALVALAGPARALDYATDPVSGYALGGRDPVAYFIDRMPREGDRRQELRWDDTVWMFVNEGNRAAFAKDPQVYAPHLRGCDPLALAEGFVTIGNPLIFALHEGRLLLFHSEINRFLFLSDPASLLAEAESRARAQGCSR
ncbi:hypothetical protein [Stappia indica]|uniref:hypothetical protein n=1 Tax=Stappia indica TaxID=538381 RepID=UPI001AD8EA8A|nr:hypothetical protein [Stappia indica]